MPPKQQQSKITNYYGQQLERPPLSFTSPPRPGDSDNYGDSSVVMPQTPSQSQSPGVIVPGTPATSFSLEAQSVSRSVSPVLGHTYDDHEAAFKRREGVSTQFPPRSLGPMLSPTATNQHLDAAAQQLAPAQAQDAQNYQEQLADARAREVASRGRGILTQFQGGKTRSKMAKKSKKTNKSNKRRSRRSKSRSRSRSKKSYSY